MRLGLVVFLLLSVVTSTRSKPAIACVNKNPLVGMLINQGVKTYQTPKKVETPVCKAEWSLHNTCCQPESLVAYGESDTKKVDTSIDAIHLKVKKILNYAKKHQKEVIRMYQSKSKLGKLAKFKTDLEGFISRLDDYTEKTRPKQQGTFLSVSQARRARCFQLIKNVRTSSLCYTCSGRSDYFFLQGRALISMPVCRKVVEECAGVWKTSMRLFRALLHGQSLSRHFRPGFVKRQLNFADEHKSHLSDWIGSVHIQEPINNCSSDMNSCSNNDAKKLCERFLSLGSNVVGVPLRKAVSKLKTLTSSSTTTTGIMHCPVARTTWAVGSGRVLQTEQLVELKEPGLIGVATDTLGSCIPMPIDTAGKDLTNLLQSSSITS